MAETDYFGARLNYGRCRQTGELAGNSQKIYPRQSVLGISLAKAIIVGSSVKRFNWRMMSYKIILPEAPVIGQVEYQDECANQHYYAIHYSPNLQREDSNFMPFLEIFVKEFVNKGTYGVMMPGRV